MPTSTAVPLRESTRGVTRLIFRRRRLVLPAVLALFFGLWSLRGAFGSNVVDTDAARHLMNGVFLHDLVRDRAFTNPASYGRNYYAHLPALSMPYHPPLFPAVEAAFFALFGVNLFAARLAVALSVAASAWLMSRLILREGQPQVVALAATATFFTSAVSLRVSNDVMLEFPSLALGLAALWTLGRSPHRPSLGAGLAFGVLAGAAVWTKQTALFLGAVPFLWIAFSGALDALRGKVLWISSAAFAVLAGTALLLPRLVNFSGASGGWPKRTLIETVLFNLQYYGMVWKRGATLPGLVLIALGLAALIVFEGEGVRGWLRRHALWMAWFAAAFGLLLPLAPYEDRYLFYANAGLIAVGYASLFRLASLVIGRRRARILPAAIAVPLGLWQLRQPAAFLGGPDKAAGIVFRQGLPSRVLYCGETNGTFSFCARLRDDRLHTAVIRGDKLPGSVFTLAGIEDFAHRYGTSYIVLERSGVQKWPWASLASMPPASMSLIAEVPLNSSSPRLNGSLLVYRFLNPSPAPEKSLSVKNEILGREVQISY